MTSSPSPVLDNQAASDQARMASIAYWVNGLAPILTNIITPIVTFIVNRKPSTAVEVLMGRYNMQVHEVMRQLISGTIGIVAYFGGGELTRLAARFFDSRKSQSTGENSNQTLQMLLGGTLMNLFGYGCLRPKLQSLLILKFLKKESSIGIKIDERQALDLTTKTSGQSPVERAKTVKQFFAELAKQEKPVTFERFPLRQIQTWVDKHLFDSVGKPLLGKTAVASTVALTVWLTSLTGLFYGLNRLLGGHSNPNKTPSLHPNPTNPGGWRYSSASLGQSGNIGHLQPPLPHLPPSLMASHLAPYPRTTHSPNAYPRPIASLSTGIRI